MGDRRALLLAGGLLVAIAAGCAAIVAGAGFDRAVESFERGDYGAAAAQAEEAIAGGRDTARLRTLLGWSLYKLGDLERARAEFERALRLDPRDPNAYFAHEGLGWIAYKGGDLDRAQAAFGESLRLVPGYHNAHTGLGWVALARRDLVRAEANFSSALQQAPGDRDARRGLAFVAYHRGNWAAAIERFRAVVREDESDTLARSALAWALYYAGDLAAARPLFQDVARREPTWADPLLGLAWVAERQGQAAEAKTAFRAAMDKSAPYVAVGAPGTAVRGLLAARPEWVDLWGDLGWALFQQRAFGLAEAEFRRILERHPADADALRGLGFALYALQRYREAIAPLERSAASGASLPPVHERVEIPGAPGLHPIVSDATSTLAWSHYRLGDFATALKLFREVTSRHPDWADAWSGLGWTLARRGERGEAEQAFRRSLAAQPDYADALAGLQAIGRRRP